MLKLKDSTYSAYRFLIQLHAKKKKVDNSYLTILTQFSNNTRGSKKVRDKMQYVNCQDKFQNFDIDLNITQEFDNLTLCINNNSVIQGQFIDTAYTYYAIKVIRCKNVTKTKYPDEFGNVTCRSDAEFTDYIKDLMIIYIDISYYFSPNNYTNPVQYFINKNQFSFVENLCYKADMFLSNSIVQSYDSILPNFGSFIQRPTIYNYLSIVSMTKFYAIYSNSDNELLNLLIRSANTQDEKDRYYNSLFQILAMLVGLWQAICAFLGFIIYRYLDFSENIEMCNKIFKLVDPSVMEKFNHNPYIADQTIEKKSSQFINSIKNSNVEELVLYEGSKYDKYAGIKFNSVEIILHMFFYNHNTTSKKLKIVDYASQYYNNFKDAKTLFNFAINLKEFLKFNFSKDQIYIISNFLNKAKFHHKNIENYKIIRNIVSYAATNDEEEKILERKEILKNTLIKFRNRKRGELNPIDEKLLKLLRIEDNLLDFFIYNENNSIGDGEVLVVDQTNLIIPIITSFKK